MVSLLGSAQQGRPAGGARSGGFEARLDYEEVYRDENVVWRKIDDRTYIGSGHVMASETLYLLEGDKRALLIDAGTVIPDLDKIVARLTDKPVTLVLTHVHPDHCGAVGYFDTVWINPADTVNVRTMMADYKGEIKYFKNHQKIRLGGRTLEVFFTPGHTPGSTTFLEVGTEIGYSGDSFGNGNLLLGTDFSTLKKTCEQSYEYFSRKGYKKFYNGHFFGNNFETLKRIDDLRKIAVEVLDGSLEGELNQGNSMMGLNRVINRDGVRVNYGDAQLK